MDDYCRIKFKSGSKQSGWNVPMNTVRLLREAAQVSAAASRTGGATIGDLVMVLPSAREREGCVRPGEVGKFVKDDRDHQPFKVEKLDASTSSYYYEGDMRKATDAEIAASRSSTGSAIAVGCSVRVRASVSSPRYDWGSVSHASVGKVMRIDADGDVIINWGGVSHSSVGKVSRVDADG